MTVKTKRHRNSRKSLAGGDVGLAIGARLSEAVGDELQQDFAADIDLSQSALSHYMRGLVPQAWLVLRRMVEEKGVDANWLLTGRRNGK